MKKKEKELLEKTIVRSLLLLIAVFSLITGIFVVVESMDENKKEARLTYDTEGKINYRVNLKSNEFYESSSLTKKDIVSKYIDSIYLYFQYYFSSSKLVDSNASYQVKIYLVNKDHEEKELWNKEWEAIPSIQEKKEDISMVNWEQGLSLSYDEYNELAKKFRNETGVLTESYLKVEFSIQNEIQEKESTQKDTDSHTLNLIIPLLENVTSIENNDAFQDQIILYTEKGSSVDIGPFITGILLIVVSMAFTSRAIKMFMDINYSTHYLGEQKRILKRYGDIIAETSTKPDLTNTNIIEITNILDLVNIEDELRVPILYYEVIKGKESWFIINHENRVYRYILKNKQKNTNNKKGNIEK